MASVPHLLRHAELTHGGRPRVAVVDAGPFDLLTHMAHAQGFPRIPFLKAGTERLGGKLSQWGLSAPRVPAQLLRQWPYEATDLLRRFETVEAELSVPDPVPYSGRTLEMELLSTMRDRFPDCPVRVAPLAIDRDGRRWCPLSYIPSLVSQGVRLASRFRCRQLIREGDRITAVRGQWLDGRTYTWRPDIVVLGVGVEPSLPLIRQVADGPLPLEVADHIRIDLHGSLHPASFGKFGVEELGIAVLIMDCKSKKSGIPFHCEIKVSPRVFWKRGAMQSGDNLAGNASDDTIFVQIQAVAAMHDRVPTADLLQMDGGLPPVWSLADALFHAEIIQVMRDVAAALGLVNPHFCPRPPLQNHHLYGAYRVGKAVTEDFRFEGIDNLYVLPPTAYVDCDDDANPTLKSLVLAQIAMEAIAQRFGHPASVTNGAFCGYAI
jgi:hypothetical protein